MPSSAIKAAMFIPRLLKDAKKNNRLMGLSKPRPKRNVDRMKRIPMRENMEVTLSAIIKAFVWLGVACTAMAGVLLAVEGLIRGAKISVVAAWKPAMRKTVCLDRHRGYWSLF